MIPFDGVFYSEIPLHFCYFFPFVGVPFGAHIGYMVFYQIRCFYHFLWISFFRKLICSLCIQKQKTTFIKRYQFTVLFFRGLIFCIKLLKMNKGSISS